MGNVALEHFHGKISESHVIFHVNAMGLHVKFLKLQVKSMELKVKLMGS